MTEHDVDVALHLAEKGEVLELALFIREKNIDIPSYQASSSDLLTAAIRHIWQAETVESLIRVGFDPNVLNHDGLPYLFLCCSKWEDIYHMEEKIDTLLKYVEDPNIRCLVDGVTPLMHAASQGHLYGVQRLLDCGADVHAISHNGSTALHFAANGGTGDCIMSLVNRGADIYCKNALGLTPKDIAEKRLRFDNLRVLRQLEENT